MTALTNYDEYIACIWSPWINDDMISMKWIYLLRFSTSSMVSGKATPFISGNSVTSALYSTDITPETNGGGTTEMSGLKYHVAFRVLFQENRGRLRSHFTVNNKRQLLPDVGQPVKQEWGYNRSNVAGRRTHGNTQISVRNDEENWTTVESVGRTMYVLLCFTGWKQVLLEVCNICETCHNTAYYSVNMCI